MQQYEDSGFAKRCRNARKLLGLSQEEFAEKFEPAIAPDTVSRWERGLTRPDPHNVQQITDGSVKETERQAAQAIITTLDGLPLAIEQVSAYIDLTHCSFSQYLQLYQRRHKELLGEGVPADYPKTVATTWSLSFKRVEEAHPAAANLLRLCSFLSPDGIPEEIITEGVFGLEGGQAEATDKQLQFNRAVTAVLQYSLLQKDSEKETLHMHRLVQTVLRDNMDRAEQQHWAERAVVAVNGVFPDVEFRNWQRCLRYLPQVQICAELIEQYDIPFIAAVRLLEQAGRYLTEIAQYDQAEQFLTRALTLQEEHARKEHAQNADYPGRASIRTCLAKLCYKQAMYTQAGVLYGEGLDRYGYTAEAQRLRRKWCDLCATVFAATGTMWEKYNVVNTEVSPEGGLYGTVTGFGWSNAVFVDFVRHLSLQQESLTERLVPAQAAISGNEDTVPLR